MNDHAVKVTLSAAFGAGIGLLVSMSLGHDWWADTLSLLTGALMGYLIFQARQLASAIQESVCTAIAPEQRMAWVRTGRLLLTMLLFGMNGVIIGIILAWSGPERLVSSDSVSGMAIGSGIFGACCGLFWCFSIWMGAYSSERDQKIYRSLFIRMLPPVFFFWTIPSAIAKVLWRFFLIIHSDERLTSGFGAFVGTAVGVALQAQSFLAVALCMAIGGLAGFISHALITERWLRPKGFLPKKASA